MKKELYTTVKHSQIDVDCREEKRSYSQTDRLSSRTVLVGGDEVLKIVRCYECLFHRIGCLLKFAEAVAQMKSATTQFSKKKIKLRSVLVTLLS